MYCRALQSNRFEKDSVSTESWDLRSWRTPKISQNLFLQRSRIRSEEVLNFLEITIRGNQNEPARVRCEESYGSKSGKLFGSLLVEVVFVGGSGAPNGKLLRAILQNETGIERFRTLQPVWLPKDESTSPDTAPGFAKGVVPCRGC